MLHNGSTLFRRYELNYEPALSATKRSRLASVQECAGSGSNCLASTQFTYQDGTPPGAEANTGHVVNATTVFPIDVNSDGREDLVYPNGTGPWTVMFANTSGSYNTPISTGVASTGSSGAIPIDHNSDGKMDLLVPYSGGTWWVLTIAANGSGSINPTGAAAPATGTGINARALDIDGDGREDLVWGEFNTTPWAGGEVIRWRKRSASGAGFDAAVDLVPPTDPDEWMFSNLFGDWAQKTPRRTPDFNGDGRGDFVYRHKTRQIINPEAPPVEKQYFTVVCPGAPSCLFQEEVVGGAPYFGDLNGDGLSDLVYLAQSGFYLYRFSTGTSFTGAGNTGFGPSYGWILIFDWDSDGFDDVLGYNTTNSIWYVARSNGETLLPAVSTGIADSTPATTVVTDLNGDRRADIAYRGSGSTWRYRAHSSSFEYPDVLETATDGFGVAATFAYRPITQSSVYTKGTGAAFPVIDSQRPLWVVSTLTATDGSGNNSTYNLTFTYEAAREHLRGRGFLGFAKRTVVDSRLGYNIKTIDTYKQAFPYIGALEKRERKRSNGVLISVETHTWDNLLWGTGGSTERRFPFVRSRTVDEHELDAPGTKFRTTATVVASGSTGIDSASGLIIDSTTTTTDVINAESKTERIVHSTKLNDTAHWCIGRPIDTAVTNQHTLPNGGALTRNFDATWDGLKCRPTQQRVEPDNTTWKVTVDLLYDDFGNVSSETVTGAGMAARTTLRGWGARGHFLHSVTNPLNQVTAQTWNDALGLPATQTDPNGFVTTWDYEEFGRREVEIRPDGTRTTWTYETCGTCDSRVRYLIRQLEKDTAQATFRQSNRYFNRWDAVGWESVQLLDSDFAYRFARDFDARGRLIKEHVPYFSGQAQNGNRRWSYDLLDRVLTDGLYTAGAARSTIPTGTPSLPMRLRPR